MSGPAGDLLGGAVEIRVKQNGQFVSLASVVGVNNTVNFIESVKVKISLLSITQIEITLDPPLEQAITFIRSGVLGLGFSTPKTKSKKSQSTDQISNKPEINVVLNEIAIKLYYGGLESPWFKGLLLQPEITIGAEGISITMKAIGMLFSVNISSGTVLFPDKSTTKKKAVEEYFGKQVDIRYAPKASAALDNIHLPSTSTNRSHLEVIKDILQSVSCKFTTLGSDTPKGKESIRIFHVSEGRLKHDAEFVAYRQINPAARQFPITSFSSSLQNILLGKSIGKIIGAKGSTNFGNVKGKAYTNNSTTDSLKDRPAVTNHDNTTAGGANQGESSPNGENNAIAKPSVMQSLYPATKSVADIVKGYVHDFTDKVFEYDVTAVGVVDLLPGRLAKVSISDIDELSGVYDLTEVEHTVSTGGVETRMSMVRTGGFITAASEGVERVKDTAKSAVGKSKKSSGTGVIP